MVMPSFTMRQLLEAGVHFGHRTRRWNPKMAPYIFGIRNKVHIIDLRQTVPLLHQAMQAVRAVAANGGRVLFVGTKRQASKSISEAAQRCGQYYVDHRWLGGMLTNWKTISNSIKKLRDLEVQLADEEIGLTKKELLRLTRARDKLDRALGGIKEMGAPPDIIIVIDTNREEIAVHEAAKLKIPVIAVIDSNSNPDGIDYPIPGNDDSLRAIELYCDLLSGAVLGGLEEEARKSGADVGESESGMIENLPPEGEAAKAEGEAAKTEKPKTAAEASTESPAAAPTEKKAAEEKAPAEKASEDKASKDKATEDKAAEDKAAEKKATEDKAAEKKADPEKPAEAAPAPAKSEAAPAEEAAKSEESKPESAAASEG